MNCDFCKREFIPNNLNSSRFKRRKNHFCCSLCCLNSQRVTVGQLKANHVYRGILERCTSVKCKAYESYGGRGIKCLWKNFKEFCADMGDPPEGMSIERIDTNGNYCKENCKWATVKEQANNRRTNKVIIFDGKRNTLVQWSEKLNIPYSSLQKRLLRGWSIERSFTEKIHLKKFRCLEDVPIDKNAKI